MAQTVVDKAMQVCSLNQTLTSGKSFIAHQIHGALGLSRDRPLAQFFAWARILRLADGPDEVHRASVGKMELKQKTK